MAQAIGAAARAAASGAALVLAACSGGGGPAGGDAAIDGPSPIDAGRDGASVVDAAIDAAVDASTATEHDPRFIGLWAVEQPLHALYEVTYYRLAADGVVTIGPSEPPDCSGHLSRHCVTGSVARCTPVPPQESCIGTPTCVFGDRWYSLNDRVLVFAGVCSDNLARDLVIGLAADPTHDTDRGGAGGTLLTVGGETGWSHDNWTWSFRKCPAGTTPANCRP
jgi:hypothetical protein